MEGFMICNLHLYCYVTETKEGVLDRTRGN